MEKRKWIIFVGLVVLVLGLMVWKSNSKSNPIDLSQVDRNQIITANEQNGQIGDWIIGDNNAKVVVIEYSNFQCSACAEHSSKIKSAIQQFDQDVALAVRHYPSPNYPNSKAASAAAEAAGKQGKFWEMSDKLYKTFITWGAKTEGRDEYFRSYAKELGLNVDQFDEDMKSDSISRKINFDTALGEAHKIDATPTIIINDQKIDPEVWSDPSKLADLIKSKL